ncbi:hypothetical protein [Azohydromonas sediminis]|uniref:hypothetical protein n=1 Tax=Azohydromonas sediminis TaxID=2259674 RepID=UPI000E651EC6|nr:hypothetical protein [Azohydromonas sediminis]
MMSSPSRLQRLRFSLALSSMAICAPALTGQPFAPTPTEIRALPDACRVRLDQGTKAEWEAYQAKLGRPIWDHLHHFCYAMNFMNRQVSELHKPTRRNQLEQAINNYDYVLARWPKDHPLYKEAAMGKRQAEIYLQMVKL